MNIITRCQGCRRLLKNSPVAVNALGEVELSVTPCKVCGCEETPKQKPVGVALRDIAEGEELEVTIHPDGTVTSGAIRFADNIRIWDLKIRYVRLRR